MNPWPTNRLPTLEWNLPSQSTNKNTIISYLVVLVSRLNPRRSPRMDGATVSSSRTCRRCREWMKNVNGKDPRARPQYAGAIIAFWLTEKLSLPLPRPLWIHDIPECIKDAWLDDQSARNGWSMLEWIACVLPTVSQPFGYNQCYCTGYTHSGLGHSGPWPDPCTTRRRHGEEGEMFSFANEPN